jgi:signal transduction histidine kinase
MKPFLPRTLQARLILTHLFVALTTIALMAVITGLLAHQTIRREVEQSYQNLAVAVAAGLDEPVANYLAGELSLDEVRSRASSMLLHAPLNFAIYLPDGQPLLASSESLPAPADPESAPDVWAEISEIPASGSVTASSYLQADRLYLAARIGSSEDVLAVLRLDIPGQVFWEAARRILGMVMIAALTASLLATAVGYWLARRVGEPIENLVQAAESLSQGEFHTTSVSPTDPLELHRLVVAFNNIGLRMKANIDEMRTFVAYASHELRTPLTSIKLRVEALRNGALDDPPVTDRFLSEIESEVDRLSHMVNDLLDLSRIEAGLEVSQLVPLNISTITDDVFEIYRVRAQRAGIDLSYHAEPALPLILGEEDQLRRMIYNLVDNAIKYTPRDGAVSLILKSVQPGDKIQLLVQDTGFGIPKEHLPHIFDRFYRVEATRPRYGPTHGSGLGLAIARTIAENHGGRIWVTSQVSKGSTFGVELPVLDGDQR